MCEVVCFFVKSSFKHTREECESKRDVFSVCGSALFDRPCMVFQRVCVLCL